MKVVELPKLGRNDPVKMLRDYLADIEAGREPKPDYLALVAVEHREETDSGELHEWTKTTVLAAPGNVLTTLSVLHLGLAEMRGS